MMLSCQLAAVARAIIQSTGEANAACHTKNAAHQLIHCCMLWACGEHWSFLEHQQMPHAPCHHAVLVTSEPVSGMQEAAKIGKSPDFFYCKSLLEETGVTTVPGSGFKQVRAPRPGARLHALLCESCSSSRQPVGAFYLDPEHQQDARAG